MSFPDYALFTGQFSDQERERLDFEESILKMHKMWGGGGGVRNIKTQD